MAQEERKHPATLLRCQLYHAAGAKPTVLWPVACMMAKETHRTKLWKTSKNNKLHCITKYWAIPERGRRSIDTLVWARLIQVAKKEWLILCTLLYAYKNPPLSKTLWIIYFCKWKTRNHPSYLVVWDTRTGLQIHWVVTSHQGMLGEIWNEKTSPIKSYTTDMTDG